MDDMSNDKYQLLENDTKEMDGVKVHRIQALKSFRWNEQTIQEGDLGGYIQSEDNLSHELGDSSWVSDNSIVYGDSVVRDDTYVEGNSIVKDSVIEHVSHVKGSFVKGSNIGATDVYDTHVHLSDIGGGRVTNSTVNNSRVINTGADKSQIVEAYVKDSELKSSKARNVVLSEGNLSYEAVGEIVELSDNDLVGLDEPSKAMEQ